MQPGKQHRLFMNALAIGLLLLAVGPASAATGSAAADLDSRDYTLEVVSAHGAPTPAVGIHTYAWHANVTASIDAVADTYTCTGWTGTGAIPVTGTSHTTGAVMLTNVDSSITWGWKEQTSHIVTLHPGGHGSISEANSSIDYVKMVTNGAAFPAVTVTPVAGYTFTGWTPAAPVTVTNDFEATAEYSPSPGSFNQWLADLALVGDPAAQFRQDRNGDGMPNGVEYAFGANWQPGKALQQIRVVNGRSVFELPEQDASTLPYVDLRILGSTNLIDWTLPISQVAGAAPGSVWYQLDGPPTKKAFFKLEAMIK